MKKRYIKIVVYILTFVFMMLPASFIYMSPSNLVEDGDFSMGDDTYWPDNRNAIFDGDKVTLYSGEDPSDFAWVAQTICTSNECLRFSFDVMPYLYDGDGEILAGIRLFKGVDDLGPAYYNYGQSFQEDEWSSGSFTLKEVWEDFYATSLPDFDKMSVWVEIDPTSVEAYFDNISLTPYKCGGVEAEEPWVRTMPMTCWRVWINEEGNFQFVFWYPYRDENFVRIYDMEGNMVYEADMPVHDPNLIVDLPDGMYTVKTFHGLVPLQEFIIGKP